MPGVRSLSAVPCNSASARGHLRSDVAASGRRAICVAGHYANLAQCAIRWILDHDGVTAAIPGASKPSQVDSNIGAGHTGHKALCPV